jgi:type IV pilus assembly protein PilQ
MTTLRIRTPGRLLGAAFAALTLLLSPAAWAQTNAVESITFSSVQGGKVIVKVGMKEALATAPQGFAVTNPPRIAIDLPDTANALGRSQVEAGEGDLKSISVVQTANRTRLVMNLTRNLAYTQAIEGKTLARDHRWQPGGIERPGHADRARPGRPRSPRRPLA